MALTMGMKVIGYDPAISIDIVWRLSSDVKKMDSLESLFSNSDYVSLHLPVLESTRKLINSDLLKSAKTGCKLLNFARSEIVDADAIVESLDRGQLSSYIADFPKPNMIGRDDVILMPHIGASTDEAEENCAVMVANQLSDYLENGNIINSVRISHSSFR